MKYIIGSRLMREFFPEFRREPKDYDYLVESEVDDSLPRIAEDGNRIEYHAIHPLYKYVSEHGMSIDVFFTLKASHLFWDIFWEKHMFDAVYLHERGAKLIRSLFDELYAFWNEYHSKNRRSQLNMTKEDFFNNALKKYDHDTLHTYINPNPTYQKVLKDGADVDVDINKFLNLSYEDKLELVREEVYVMAFERLAGRSYRSAYAWMLKKFIMEHAPMEEAIFIIENYRTLHLPPIDYVEIIENGLKLHSELVKGMI